MDNLTEGQRIDVYEVVDAHDYMDHHEIVGFQALASKTLRRWDISVLVKRDYGIRFLGFNHNQVQKCGYYLKVKSLNTKGVNNES